MSLKAALYASLGLIACSLALGIYFYPALPDSIPSHWNAAGEIDGYLPKAWGVFLLPVFALLLLGVLLLIPKIDPRRKNIEEFRGAYHGFVLAVVAFLAYLHLLTLLAAQGAMRNIVPFLIPALALFFWLLGGLLQKTKPNWMIGIRTPWTLESETVWKKTHDLGATLFRGLAAILLFALVEPRYGFYIFIGGAIGSAIFLVAYSWWAWRKEAKP